MESLLSDKNRTRLKEITPYLYLIPALVVMAFITFYPMGYQLYMSFTDYNVKNLRGDSCATGRWTMLFNPKALDEANKDDQKVMATCPKGVGLQNYLNILVSGLPSTAASDSDLGDKVSRTLEGVFGYDKGSLNGLPTIPNFNFWRMLAFNLFWTFSNVIFHVGLGILIAVILNVEGLKGRSIYRAIFVLPMVLPSLIIATVWKNMYDPDFGAISQLIQGVGKLFGVAEGAWRIRWIDETNPPLPWFLPGLALPWSYYAMLITNIWLGWPFMTIVATGALQSIPKDLYEAASIDGATEREQFWKITLPLLRPAMVPAAVLGIITTFNLLHVIYFISAGGPLRQTEILVTTAFRLVNENKLYGMAAAFCVYIFLILLALTALTNRYTKATESYDA